VDGVVDDFLLLVPLLPAAPAVVKANTAAATTPALLFAEMLVVASSML
jgi:hypothetical protein